MGARLRALLLLLVLLGGALGILVHLSVTLMAEHEVRMKRYRFTSVVSAAAYAVRGRARTPAEQDELALVLRQLTGARVWVVAMEEGGARLRVFPGTDLRALKPYPAPSILANLPTEGMDCTLDLPRVEGGGLCRMGLPGVDLPLTVLVPAVHFAVVRVRHLPLLAAVAGVAWLLLAIAGYIAFTLFFVRPLWRIERAMERAATTDRWARLEPSGAPEFRAIAEAFNTMVKTAKESEDRIRFQLEALTRSHEELVNTRQDLVRSEQLAQVGVLAAGIAHEVGNPLGIAAGYVEMLAAEDLAKEDRERYVRRVDRALSRIQSILRNLLDFSRREADDGPSRCSVERCYESVAELVRPQRRFDRVQLIEEIDTALPEVGIPQARLEQVLLNLLMNAADAVGPGGLVKFTAALEGSQISLRVIDDGPGIPEPLRGRIFEPFVTSKERGGGTGLGLFVCRHIITAYGGEITVSVGAAGGTTFLIRLWPADSSKAIKNPVMNLTGAVPMRERADRPSS